MGDVISLNRYRKQRRQRDSSARAAINRLRFGRTKAERQADRAESERESTQLDQKRLTGPKQADNAASDLPADTSDDEERRS